MSWIWLCRSKRCRSRPHAGTYSPVTRSMLMGCQQTVQGEGWLCFSVVILQTSGRVVCAGHDERESGASSAYVRYPAEVPRSVVGSRCRDPPRRVGDPRRAVHVVHPRAHRAPAGGCRTDRGQGQFDHRQQRPCGGRGRPGHPRRGELGGRGRRHGGPRRPDRHPRRARGRCGGGDRRPRRDRGEQGRAGGRQGRTDRRPGGDGCRPRRGAGAAGGFGGDRRRGSGAARGFGGDRRRGVGAAG